MSNGNSKYSNVLTMLLIVFVVAILGIIGYFSYTIISANATNKNAQSTIDEFEAATKKVKRKKKEDTGEEDIENSTLSDFAGGLSQLAQDQQVNGVNTSEETEEGVEEIEKVYMEGYEVKGTISIPKTGINYPILDRVDKRSLEIAVAVAYPIPAPEKLNEPGNVVIYGHNYRNGMFFSDNKKLGEGDEIIITDQYGVSITYKIYEMFQTTSNDASFFDREVEEGVREISLQTCTDDSKNRIIIKAREK